MSLTIFRDLEEVTSLNVFGKRQPFVFQYWDGFIILQLVS